MGWALETAKVHKITTKLATEFASMDAAPHDRAMSERRLAVYERQIREGQWRPCVWASARCLETNTTYRVNGKHTSTLFSTLASEFPEHVVTVEHYVCDTLEDVGRLYGTFDSAMNSRSTSDINRAFAATIPELANLPRKIIDVCTSGMALHQAGGMATTSRMKTPTERAENLLEYPAFVIWVSLIIADHSKNRHLVRMGVVGAMFGTYLKAKQKAEEFWTAVRDETGSKPTCPDRMLAKWLSTTSVVADDMGTRPSSRKADTREFYVRCIHCWNAWRRDEELKIVRYQANGKCPAFA